MLGGERDSAAELVASYLTPTVTSAGWPLHMARAELAVCLAELNDALTVVERVDAVVHHGNAELTMWLAEVASEANLCMVVTGRMGTDRTRLDPRRRFHPRGPLESDAGARRPRCGRPRRW